MCCLATHDAAVSGGIRQVRSEQPQAGFGEKVLDRRFAREWDITIQNQRCPAGMQVGQCLLDCVCGAELRLLPYELNTRIVECGGDCLAPITVDDDCAIGVKRGGKI